jgi:hypothetical protein
MSKKEPTFELYKTMMFNTEEGMRAIGGKNVKHMTRRQMIQDVAHHEPHFMDGLNVLIMCEEWNWARTSKRVLFPESTKIFERLLNADYTMSSAKGFNLPYSSFTLAMPSGLVHDGVELPPCLVDYGPYEKAESRLIHPFCDYLGMPHSKVNIEDCSPGAHCLTITYREEGTLAYVRAMISDDDLPGVLESKSPEECSDRIGDYGHLNGLVAMNDRDKRIQFWLLRLISAIGVYHVATSGQHLHEGFPGKKLPTLLHRDPSQPILMSYLSTAQESEIKPALTHPKHDKRETEPSAWHFNQNDRSGYTEDDSEADDNPFGLYFASGGN